MRRPLLTLALAVALAAAAAALASLALFAVAIGFVLTTVAAGTTVALAAGRLTVIRTISAREVQENASIHLRFRVRGTSWLPVRLEVEDHSGGWTAIGGPDASLELRVGRRGPHWLAPSRLRLRDAVGIFERRLLAGRAEPLLILPTPDGLARMHADRSTAIDDPEPDGLAPYAPGTPLARIHWPAFARGAGLQVRRSAPSASGLPLVVVDVAGAPSSQALDWAARTAAGYILALARDGGCRVLLPGDSNETNVTRVDGEWRAMHRRLALLGDSASIAARAANAHARTLFVRAATAPAGLPVAPPLPQGVQPRSPHEAA